MKTRGLWIAAMLLVVTACSGSGSSDPVADARSAFDEADYATVCSICDTALADSAVAGDPKTSAALKLLRVKALASLSDAEAVLTGLGDLPAMSVTTALFVDLAGKLTNAGNLIGAIEVAHAGNKRFPDKKDEFSELIQELKDRAKEGGDDAATEKLRSLGYL